MQKCKLFIGFHTRFYSREARGAAVLAGHEIPYSQQPSQYSSAGSIPRWYQVRSEM